MKSFDVCAETIVLVFICLADMISTMYFVAMGMAVEQNPIMASFLDKGPAVFILAKIVSFLPFVVAVEICRRKNPNFAKIACRWAIGAYLAAYVMLTLGVNTHLFA